MENIFLDRLNITRDTPDYRNKVLDFWNENNELIICENEGTKVSTVRIPQHFLKRVIDLHMENQLFYGFLFEDEDRSDVDVNAVEIYNGQAKRFWITSIISSMIPTCMIDMT